MAKDLDKLNRLLKKISQLPVEAPLPQAGGKLLSAVAAELGAQQGVLAACEQRGAITVGVSLPSNQALENSLSRYALENLTEIINAASGPPRLLEQNQDWPLELAWLAEFLTGPGCWRSALPLWWQGGGGMLALAFEQAPGLSGGLAGALAGGLSQAVQALLLRHLAWGMDEDYRRLFENSPDMIYLSSRDGRWADVNPAGVAMLGYRSREELLAVPDIAQAAYLRHQDRRAFQEAIESQGFVSDYQVDFKRKDGTPIQVSITAQVRKREGQIIGYEGIIKDITAAKTAQEEAQRQQRLLAAILSVMPVAVFVLDQEHRVIHWNRACEQLTGIERQSILGSDKAWQAFSRSERGSLADLVLSGDAKALKRQFGDKRLRTSPLGQEAWEAEDQFQKSGKPVKELLLNAAALRGPKGELMGAIEVVLDVSDIKGLEQRLAESEALYRTLVESSLEGIALHDGDEFVFANQPFLAMFGLAELKEAGGDFLGLLNPQSRGPYLQWRRQLEEGAEPEAMFSGQGVRGQKDSFDLELSAVDVSYQRRPAVLFTVHDVTYRRQMEEQLIRQERLAATGKLAFDIAHEINNPLGGILTYSHLLAEELPEESTAGENAQKIIRLVNRCQIIVRGLLDFAREEPTKKQAFDLNKAFHDVLGLMEGHLILRKVDIQAQLQEDLPWFYGHRNKIEQVFLNLIINAAEAMSGKGILVVKSWLDPEPGELKFRFQDNGPGISPEIAARVFEPFFTTKERGRGTGLGLSISHGIIKQHGGRLELKSRPGQGCQFTVVLPAEELSGPVMG